MGFGNLFWDGDIDAGYRHLLAPSGLDLEDLRRRPGGIAVPLQTRYRKYGRDLMVINVTKDNIVVRMATVDEYVLPPNVTKAYVDAERSGQKEASKYILGGKWKGYTPPEMPKK